MYVRNKFVRLRQSRGEGGGGVNWSSAGGEKGFDSSQSTHAKESICVGVQVDPVAGTGASRLYETLKSLFVKLIHVCRVNIQAEGKGSFISSYGNDQQHRMQWRQKVMQEKSVSANSAGEMLVTCYLKSPT